MLMYSVPHVDFENFVLRKASPLPPDVLYACMCARVCACVCACMHTCVSVCFRLRWAPKVVLRYREWEVGWWEAVGSKFQAGWGAPWRELVITRDDASVNLNFPKMFWTFSWHASWVTEMWISWMCQSPHNTHTYQSVILNTWKMDLTKSGKLTFPFCFPLKSHRQAWVHLQLAFRSVWYFLGCKQGS